MSRFPLLLELATAVGGAALAASAAFGVASLIAARYRSADAKFWHSVWAAIAVTALVAPVAAMLPPVWRVGLPIAATSGYTAIPIMVPGGVGRVLVVAAGVYFVCAGALLVSVAVGLLAAVRMRRQSRPLDARGAHRVAVLMPELASLVRVHGRLRLPVTVGWHRAVILLPATWPSWSDERLVAVLRHEAAHIARRDFVWHAVAALQQAVFWMNPIAWRLARRIRLTAELAADRIAAGAEREAYATHLVEAATEAEGLGAEHTVFAPGATHSLAARIDALLAQDAAASHASSFHRVVGVVCVAVAILVPMCVRAVGIQHRPPAGGAMAATHAVRHASHGH